jgi:hypothetical protein
MPQSSKDTQGGKNHPAKSHGGSAAAKPSKSESDGQKPASPTGATRHGEKKTTP